MNFGVREICDVVFKARTDGVRIGNKTFKKGQPVLYITTAKTSSLEGATTTVYAQGGKGNPRLIAWEGERTMTFTVEDALISPVSLAMLTGAGLKNVLDADNKTNSYIYQPVQFDLPIIAVYNENGDISKGVVRIDYDTAQDAHDIYYSENKGQIFGTVLDNAGAGVYFLSLASNGIHMFHSDGTERLADGAEGDKTKIYEGECVPNDTDGGHIFTIPSNDLVSTVKDGARAGDYLELTFEGADEYVGNTLRVDCYCQRSSGATQITIDAENFAGDFYIEASTLFRDQYTKKDMPAVFVIPDAKIQSNFTFTMANSGDPSTFQFTLDAFPDYTKFDHSKKVFCAIQIIGDENVTPQTTKVVKDDCPEVDPVISSADPDKTFDDTKGVKFANMGRNLRTEIVRKNVDFFGILNPIADFEAYKTQLATMSEAGGAKIEDPRVINSELTGYYFPVNIAVESPEGTPAADATVEFSSKTGAKLKATAGKMLLAVDPNSPVVEVNVAAAKKASTYTFDFSKCVFK